MPTFIIRIFKTLLMLLVPFIFILGSVRLLATDTYLAFEYGKATFPPDTYGFTPQQRLDLASKDIHYVRGHLPMNVLIEAKMIGIPIYNLREVAHMADVQAVFQSVVRVWRITFIIALLLGFLLWQAEERKALASALHWGGMLTSAIVLLIALLASVARRSWFDTFHWFFFQPGSWVFTYTNTLVRLFPQKFWFDATTTFSLLSLIGGLIVTLVGQRWHVVIEKTMNASKA